MKVTLMQTTQTGGGHHFRSLVDLSIVPVPNISTLSVLNYAWLHAALIKVHILKKSLKSVYQRIQRHSTF